MSIEESEELIERIARARGGDRLERDALFAEAHNHLRRMVGLRISPPLSRRVSVDDIVSEAVLLALNGLADFDPTRTSWILWLRLKVRQAISSAYRREIAEKRDVRRETEMSFNDSSRALLCDIAIRAAKKSETPSAVARSNELQRKIEDAFASLSPMERDMIIMHEVERMKDADIAAELGISSVAAATKKRSRAFARLIDAIHQGSEGRDQASNDDQRRGEFGK